MQSKLSWIPKRAWVPVRGADSGVPEPNMHTMSNGVTSLQIGDTVDIPEMESAQVVEEKAGLNEYTIQGSDGGYYLLEWDGSLWEMRYEYDNSIFATFDNTELEKIV